MAYKDIEKRNAFFRKRYLTNAIFVQEYKVAKGCADCGYNAHHAGLEFDHIQPRLRGTVATQIGKSRKVLLEEIERCEVVCGTCHGVRTWNRGSSDWNPRGGRLVDQDARFSPS